MSVELTLTSLLAQAMPDLAPNPTLYLGGRRRATLQDVVLEFYDQWARTSALMSDLLSGLPPSTLFGGKKAEQLACKTLQILTALANHILRMVVSLSETILEDDSSTDLGEIELPLASGDSLVGMALSQLDQLPDQDAQSHLRSRLCSSLQTSTNLAQTAAVVNREHIDQLFRYSLEKLKQVWIGSKEDAEWERVRERFMQLCGAAVDEVAGESRRLWVECRAMGRGEKETAQDEQAPSKRVRTSVELPKMEMSDAEQKSSRASELRDLIAQTRRFLDSPVSSPRV